METFFLAIFVFGALFTIASAVLGSFSSFDHGFHVAAHHGHPSSGVFNGSSVLAFLTVFGAVGYVLLKVSPWALPGVILGAVIGGAAGAYLVARFLGLILSGEREMDPADYRLEGTVGQITVSIPQGGTGEVVFSKVGARRSEAARSLGGLPIPRGTEVVITHYADGFATVQPWAEFLTERDKLAPVENREA